jgi:hypothetical protein
MNGPTWRTCTAPVDEGRVLRTLSCQSVPRNKKTDGLYFITIHSLFYNNNDTLLAVLFFLSFHSRRQVCWVIGTVPVESNNAILSPQLDSSKKPPSLHNGRNLKRKEKGKETTLFACTMQRNPISPPFNHLPSLSPAPHHQPAVQHVRRARDQTKRRITKQRCG